MEFYQILDSLYEEIITFAVVGGVTAMVVYFKKRKDKVDKLDRKVGNLVKTQIIIAKLLDEQIKQAHPEISLELEDITRELLSDN